MASALILSGGIGSRLGASVPKQYIKVDEKPVIYFCIEQLSKHEGIDSIQVVAAKQWHNVILDCFKEVGCAKFFGFSEVGITRQLSIYNGLTDIRKYANDTSCVLIHDAARPLISAEIITKSLKAVEGHDGVLPVLSMKDTIYESIDGKQVSALLNRETLYAGQAPETFRIGPYYRANERLLPDKIREINGSTEPAVLAGLDIMMIQGDEQNFKITTKEDLDHFCDVLKQRQCAYFQPLPGPDTPKATHPSVS